MGSFDQRKTDKKLPGNERRGPRHIGIDAVNSSTPGELHEETQSEAAEKLIIPDQLHGKGETHPKFRRHIDCERPN